MAAERVGQRSARGRQYLPLRANCRRLKPTSGRYTIELVEGLKIENVEVGVLTERDRQAPRGNSPQR